MTHFLDTDIRAYYLKGAAPEFCRRVHDLTPDNIKIPAIVPAELLYGARKSNNAPKAVVRVCSFSAPFEVVPFTDQTAERYGMVRSELEKRGTPIGPNDLLIAATVLEHDGPLVTHNTREFARVDGLKIEDWAS